MYIKVSNQIYTLIYIPVFWNSIWISLDCSFRVIDGIFSISVSFPVYFQ